MKTMHENFLRLRGSRTLAICLVVLGLASFSLLGQTQMDLAWDLVQAGKLKEAEAAYSEAIRHNPLNSQAYLQRAYVRSWQGFFQMAQTDFDKVLSENPQHVDARIGKAYTLAWSGNYTAAESEFLEAGKLENRPETRKGLGWVALWSGNTGLAVQRFTTYTADNPEDPEGFQGLGDAYLAEGNSAKARQAYQNALALDPAHGGALNGLAAARIAPGFVEISLVGGYSDAFGESGAGLRGAGVSIRPGGNMRFWLRYDNTLSLDNSLLLQREESAAGFMFGVSRSFADFGTTTLETGMRNLPSNLQENLIMAEQAFFLPAATVLKTGGLMISRSAGSPDFLLFSAVRRNYGKAFSLEPTFFAGWRNEGSFFDWRVLGVGEYRFSPTLSLVAGYGGGQQELAGGRESINTAHLTLNSRLMGRHQLFVTGRREAVGDSRITVAEVGLTLALERK